MVNLLASGSSYLLGIFTSALFWLLLLIGGVSLTLGIIFYRRQRKFIYTILELTDLGDGKMGIRTHKGGWFKSNKIFFGLIDISGEETLQLKDGRTIWKADSEHFHDINGRRGLVCLRKGDDPKILLPLNKMKVVNKYLLTQIAPSDYRDASVSIINRAEKETLNKWEKFAPYIAIGFMGIIFFISIILIVQMVKHGQTEAKDLILEAGKLAVQGRTNAVLPSGAP